MELAEWYETVGCYEEALTLFSFAEYYPIAGYKKAWLLHESGDEIGSMIALEKANSQTSKAVFPFRFHLFKSLGMG